MPARLQAPSRAGGGSAKPLPGMVPAGGGGAYARFVRLMRILLPAAALSLIGLVALWPHVVPRQDQFRIGFADLEVGDDDLSMIRPRYVGSDKQNRPFSIRALSVRNLVPGGEEMLLDGPEAEITLDDGTWVTVQADTGEYHVKDKELDLSGSVRLFHDKGYTFETTAARVALDHGIVSGNEAVVGHGPAGELEGTGFRVSEGGGRVFVSGPARLVINNTSQGSP